MSSPQVSVLPQIPAEVPGATCLHVAVVQPVHQHAYETAVALQEQSYLEAYVTAIYATGRGLTHEGVLARAPERMRSVVYRRHHPELHADKVVTIARYHLLAEAAALGRRLGRAHLPGAQTWAHKRFDRAAARWVASQPDLDAVHAFEGTALAAFRAAQRLGIATVLDVASAHEYCKELVAAEGGDVSRFDTTRIREERALADYLLAPSAFVRSCLVDHGIAPERIRIVPYGVDTRTFHPGERRSGPFRALFVGRISHAKGAGVLLEAWKQLALPDAELVLVGHADAEGRAILEAHVGHFNWVGPVAKRDIAEWYRSSDVFVLPTLAEGSALVSYEALASGLPIVTTPNCGSVAEDGVHGFLVPARDVGSLADRIERLSRDDALRTAMGARARTLVESSYTWHDYRARIASLYRTELDRG